MDEVRPRGCSEVHGWHGRAVDEHKELREYKMSARAQEAQAQAPSGGACASDH